ncbi:HAD-IIIA family hydrolase [Mycobacterium avium subsp. hominissuis]|uniref:D,D-heptose 1,7-bisphosphate phosphatase n=7 Tax=Mycobacterium avium TaxID=1764 RepID=A0A3B6X5H5_MYCAV|nr:HAD-IIIA family hydrolase [Mycobacterium avium]APA77297.1 HAD-IIIA family hydrolase [Mycobacterium avium subsp. hominissuis]APT12387.1 HAD family hydrolase [Mycobacterium avium subsp. hominissuis]AXO22228.1 HAD-IIIA family hydrolase [Mycobacterium avium subsp. hominissuis]MBG0727841.1 HAD-IIIA family hydrolase [Mycobacterium avium]MCA2338326.1 HAD-IIIA family hydrolase [Mycobacterium avium]
MRHDDYTLVIPTVGRESLRRLLIALRESMGPQPLEVVVVDDRPRPGDDLPLPDDPPVRVLCSGGRGPAAARNVGWRASRSRWVCFLDDDVLPDRDWISALCLDLKAADTCGAAGSQAVLEVPTPRRPSDDQRRTARLATAQWITADMAYRRDMLVAAGGFDERFPRAYREDSDLALRIVSAGGTILRGERRCTHPVAPATWRSSVRAQIGNRDNALMRRKHGRRWRTRIGEGPGRMPAHAATTAAGAVALLAGLLGRRATARRAAALWLLCTIEFAARRWLSGPRNVRDALGLSASSVLIPPVAVAHRLAGEWTFRRARPEPPLAVLLDRDDTLIVDRPYLNDPAGVRPTHDAAKALTRLRRRGLLLAVVTNQSGVARGLISAGQLAAVNDRIDEVLGPFESWQVCVHGASDGCGCRKPRPGLILAAAEALGVPPRRCVMIGDTGADVRAALAAGAAAVLVPTDRTLPAEVEHARAHARVAATLNDAVSLVLSECR